MSERDTCPSCGIQFDRLGSHWRMSSTCGYPKLSDHMRSVLTIVAAFGTVATRDDRPGTHPHLQITNKERWKLELIEDELDFMSSSIFEVGESYMLSTRKHPYITKLAREEFNKDIPDNLAGERPHEQEGDDD